MSLKFSYRHLHCFWVVGKEGGMARAASRLDLAVQTVNTQSTNSSAHSAKCCSNRPGGDWC